MPAVKIKKPVWNKIRYTRKPFTSSQLAKITRVLRIYFLLKEAFFFAGFALEPQLASW